MRTTIDIPDALLREVQQSYGVRTKREAVLSALQERVTREKRMYLHGKLRGRFPDLDLNLDRLRERTTR
jgi:Arc/MetJ family transcription regulator